MKIQRLRTGLFLAILYIILVFKDYYPQLPWIPISIIIILISIVPNVRIIYKDYHSNNVGKQTYSEILFVIVIIIITIILIVGTVRGR